MGPLSSAPTQDSKKGYYWFSAFNRKKSQAVIKWIYSVWIVKICNFQYLSNDKDPMRTERVHSSGGWLSPVPVQGCILGQKMISTQERKNSNRHNRESEVNKGSDNRVTRSTRTTTCRWKQVCKELSCWQFPGSEYFDCGADRKSRTLTEKGGNSLPCLLEQNIVSHLIWMPQSLKPSSAPPWLRWAGALSWMHQPKPEPLHHHFLKLTHIVTFCSWAFSFFRKKKKKPNKLE